MSSLVENLVTAIDQCPPYPSHVVPHFFNASWALRESYGEDWKKFSRRHPLACFIMATMYTFPGGILAAFLMNQSVLGFLLNPVTFWSYVAVWYSVFYLPGDALVKFVDASSLRIPLFAMSDFMRLNLVRVSVAEVLLKYPDGNAFLFSVLIAIVKSSGFMILKYVEYLFTTNQTSRTPFKIPNYATKSCVIAAFTFTAHAQGYLNLQSVISYENLYAAFVVVTILFRLSTVFLPKDTDPYRKIENAICSVLFGNDDGGVTPERTPSPVNENGAKKQE